MSIGKFVADTEPYSDPDTHLLEVSVRFWRDFFKLYRSECLITHSANHAF